MKILPIREGITAKSLFNLAAFLLLIFMLFSASHAGISGDEEVHYNQSVSVYNYYSSMGVNTSALNTPVTHLKYYGQSFDNITTILIRWFGIEDIYSFRHLMNSFAAWLTILLSALLAVWLSGYEAGFLTIILFALSPTFLGHAQNNLKDIPFALAYIAGTLYMLKWLFARKPSLIISLLLILSIAFCIGIRPGGLVLICYLILFALIKEIIAFRNNARYNVAFLRNKLISIGFIIFFSYLLGILLWPFVLKYPVSGFWESYKVMTQFPTTIRQIFEGRFEWSDFMPWYYLPKLMLITIPLVVWAGILCFISLPGKALKKEWLKYTFLIFTIVFPILFVIYEKSNLYGSWRHFLFIYPGIVVLSAIGIWNLLWYFKSSVKRGIILLVIFLLGLNPIVFMARNYPYYYLYYNQLVGGLKGAYGNYETDYYYHSVREGSEWLIDYLKQNNTTDSLKIGCNFPADWFFRKEKNLSSAYFMYNERSQHDWDYYLVANSYISPTLLKNGSWPPKNAIKIINADGIPICAILKRENKFDLLGYQAFNQNSLQEATKFFEDAVKMGCQDEIIFYNFASVCYKSGDKEKATVLLLKGLEINPDCERILMLQANMFAEEKKFDQAADLYQKVIRVNRKYFDAYPSLAKIWISQEEYTKARKLLKDCLMMSPKNKAAILALADSYRKTDPDVAKKYEELALQLPSGSD